MKAVIVKRYGGPEMAIVAEMPTPRISKPNQILVRVMASTINSGDARLRRADPWFVRLVFGLRGPRRPVLGAVFAGVVEAVGADVTAYRVGDRVYGMPENFIGSHAEYICIKDTTPMGKLSDEMSFTDAAALPFGGTTALHFLEGLDLAGKTMLINGASGAVGLCFLQIAVARGAQVTVVSSTPNLPLLRKLGATSVIDYTVTNIMTHEATYDVVIDCVNKIPVREIEQFANPGGTVILLAGLIKEMWQSRRLKRVKVRIGSAKVTSDQFVVMNDMYVKKQLRPIIDSEFKMNAVAAAYRVVDGGRKVGSVVLHIAA
jgi:NADPH:quinone reductase-like Zn-dependent oxidoreductase